MTTIKLRGLSDNEIFAGLTSAIAGVEFSSFEAGVSCKDPGKKPGAREKIIRFVSGSLGKTHLRDGFDLYILVDLENGFVEVVSESVYVQGRYNKLSRKLAQTFHYCFKCKGRGCKFCGFTGKLSEYSVQELLEKSFLPAFGAKESRFHGAGREDVDVLMLGSGRPFVLELVQPEKRVVDLGILGQKINSGCKGLISVHGLCFTSKQRVVELKNTEFSKIYSAKCGCAAPVTFEELAYLSEKEFAIVQVTPERVEKRRPMKKRAKTAKILSVQKTGGKTFTIQILSSHGLYIKEFVSGDSGRTKPSVSSLLGKDCRCVELDVLEIVGF